MNPTLACNPARSTRTFQAAVLYDRLESMLVANQLVGRLPSRLKNGADWQVNSWQFGLLDSDREDESALDETSGARLMMVAIQAGKSLIQWPGKWLSRWAAIRQNSRAILVLVLVGTGLRVEPPPGVIAPLLRLAKENRLEFLIVDCIQAEADSGLEFRHLEEFRRLDLSARSRPAFRRTTRQCDFAASQHFTEFPPHSAETISVNALIAGQERLKVA